MDSLRCWSSPISADFSSSFLPQSENTHAGLIGNSNLWLVASPQVASAPLNVLNFCFERNFHLPVEFDIKHTLICPHAHNYWLHLPCFVHFCAPRRRNVHGGPQEEAMIKPMMSRFPINGELESIRVKIWKSFWEISPWLLLFCPPSKKVLPLHTVCRRILWCTVTWAFYANLQFLPCILI